MTLLNVEDCRVSLKASSQRRLCEQSEATFQVCIEIIGEYEENK